MATRGNRPKDVRATKGGVRGTHRLGDAPREEPAKRRAATRGGAAVAVDLADSDGTSGRSRVALRAEAPRTRAAHEAERVGSSAAPPSTQLVASVEIEESVDASVGEEREFDLSNAMADLESVDQWADRRERIARAVLESERRHAESGEEDNDLAAWEVDSGADGVLPAPRSDGMARMVDRGIETTQTHAPGPKGKGRARTRNLMERGLR